MTAWRTLIVVASAAAALAVGLGAQAGGLSDTSLQFWQVAELDH